MPRRLATLIALSALMAAACGGDGGGEATRGWAELLGRVPNTPANRAYVSMNDYAAAREAIGLSAPGPGADEQAVYEYLTALSQGPISDLTTSPPTRSPGMAVTFESFRPATSMDLLDTSAWNGEMGFDVLNVDRDVLAGVFPDQLAIWEGSIDPQQVADAVESDPVWSDLLSTAEHLGVEYYRWGDDPSAFDRDRVTAVRPTGQGGCLVAFAGTAYRSLSPAALESAIAVREGEGTSLADVEDLQLIADGLDDAGTYAAILSADGSQFALDRAALDLLDSDQPVLEAYRAMGAGAGLDEDGTEFMVIVLIYADADAATANAATLEEIATTGSSLQARQPWSDLLTVRSIAADGRLVIGVFEVPGVRIRLWYQVIFTVDTLVAWG